VKDEEICRLKIHNQSLLTHIKKIKSDKKTIEDKLEQLIDKELLVDKETMTEPMELHKFSNRKNLMVDKAINTDLVKLTDQKPYRHSNHKNRYFNQSMYPQKQMSNMSKIITSITNDAQGRSYHGNQNTSNCLQEPHKAPLCRRSI
jgi:hypothetical protein